MTAKPLRKIKQLASRVNPRIAIVVLVTAAIGVVGLRLSLADTPTDNSAQGPIALPASADQPLPLTVYGANAGGPVEPFVNDPVRGLKWDGLRANAAGPCGEDLYEIIDSDGNLQGCTHGPDAAPPGVNATELQPPLPPEQITSANNIVCEGDGKSGKRVQAMYVRGQNIPSKYSQYSASFQEFARRANSQIIESAYRSGEARSIRFVTDGSAPNCTVNIPEVVIADSALSEFGDVVAALKAKGYNRVDRKYMIWLEYDYSGIQACGLGLILKDDKPGATNGSNSGPHYGTTGSNCWGRGTESHELLHNLGAVQASAPNSDTGAHCLDAFDRMCRYETIAPLRFVCRAGLQNLYDCNNDDFFNTSTNLPASHYLKTHWNAANSDFLIRGGNPPTDTVKPPPAVFQGLKENDVVSGTNKLFYVYAEDNVGINKVSFQWDSYASIDRTETLVLQNGNPSTDYYGVSYNTTSLSNGSHTFKATIHDIRGNTSTASITLNVQNTTTTPPPTTPPPTTPPPTTPPPTTPPPTTPPPTNPPLQGDLNNDGKVNISDLSKLLSDWGKSGTTSDLNGSGKVDIADLSILLKNWTK